MKKLNYLWMLGLLMFAAVNFSACSSSDDEEEVLGSSSDLVGLWESVSMEGWTKLNGEIYDGVEMENEKVRIKFNADGTWIGYEFNEGEFGLANVAPTVAKIMELEAPSSWEQSIVK